MKNDRVKIQVAMPLKLKKKIEKDMVTSGQYATMSEFGRCAMIHQMDAEKYLKNLSNTLDKLDVDTEEYDKKYMEYVTALFSPITRFPHNLLREKQMLLQFHRSLIGHMDKRIDELEQRIIDFKKEIINKK